MANRTFSILVIAIFNAFALANWKVFVLIDDSTNSTRTSTSLETVAITAGDETISASDWMANGTFQPLKSRRTATMTHVIDQSTTLTYPSRLVRIGATEISWDGEVPISQGNDTHCLDAKTAPPLTITTALPSLAPHSIDPNDPLGEFYKAIDFAGEHILKADEVGTYFGPTASIVYDSCTGVGTLPASWATSALFLLETSTQRINTQSQASSNSPEPTPEPSSPPKAQSEELRVTEEPSKTKTQVEEATVLVSATAANSMVTSHITISFTHPETVASWAEAAQDLLSTSAGTETSNASPTTATVDGDAVASVVASILGMTKTKGEVQAHEASASQGLSPPAPTRASGDSTLPESVHEQESDGSTYQPTLADGGSSTHDNLSGPPTANSGVAGAFETSERANDHASRTPGISSPSIVSQVFDTTAVGTGHADNGHQSPRPASQTPGTSAGDSTTVSRAPVTSFPETSTEENRTGGASQPPVQSERSSAVNEAATTSESSTAQAPFASSGASSTSIDKSAIDSDNVTDGKMLDIVIKTTVSSSGLLSNREGIVVREERKLNVED
ncbi:hypothetical protein PRZ48_007393 [Zasmidium cellare]|uniref:Uncharacterized protein n=1 Tax=Zasmidium cellare TaxID=395010 RepID=A0ABR0EJM8_ZASCE|nr:hypothetical protein PRZ48_007393 [Zasmidium cellare]